MPNYRDVMQRLAFESEAVASAGYDSEARSMEVEFRTGRIYRYSEVPPGVFEWLLRTKSKGSFVTNMVKDRFEFVEVTDAPAQDPQELLQALLDSLQDDDTST